MSDIKLLYKMVLSFANMIPGKGCPYVCVERQIVISFLIQLYIKYLVCIMVSLILVVKYLDPKFSLQNLQSVKAIYTPEVQAKDIIHC